MPPRPTPQDTDIVNVDEAARIIGKTVRGTYRAVSLGQVPPGAHWRIGRDLYFSRARLLAWRDAGGSAAPADMSAA